MDRHRREPTALVAGGHRRHGHHRTGLPLRGERGDVRTAPGLFGVPHGELGLVALVGAVLGGVPSAALEPPVAEAAHRGRSFPLAGRQADRIGRTGNGGGVGGDGELSGPPVVERDTGGALGHHEDPGLPLERDDHDRGAARAGHVRVVGLEPDPALLGRDLPAEVVGEPAADPRVRPGHVERATLLATALATEGDVLHEADLVPGQPAAPLDQGGEPVRVGQVGDVGDLAGDITQVRGGLRLAGHVRHPGRQSGYGLGHDPGGGHVRTVLEVRAVHQPADGEAQPDDGAQAPEGDGRVPGARTAPRTPPQPSHQQYADRGGRRGQQGQGEPGEELAQLPDRDGRVVRGVPEHEPDRQNHEPHAQCPTHQRPRPSAPRHCVRFSTPDRTVSPACTDARDSADRPPAGGLLYEHTESRTVTRGGILCHHPVTPSMLPSVMWVRHS